MRLDGIIADEVLAELIDNPPIPRARLLEQKLDIIPTSYFMEPRPIPDHVLWGEEKVA